MFILSDYNISLPFLPSSLPAKSQFLELALKQLRIILIVLLCYIVFNYAQRLKQMTDLYNHLPTFPTSNIIGTLIGHLEVFWFSGTNLHMTVFLGQFFQMVTKLYHQDNVGLLHFRIGFFRHLVIALNAKTAEVILSDTKNTTKSIEYDFIKPWLGEGLLTGQGRRWRQHRKLLTPSFHFSILNKFIPLMANQVDTMVGYIDLKIDEEESGKTIIEDIRPLVTNCSLDIITQTTMGVQMGAQETWIKGATHSSEEKSTVKTPEREYIEAVRAFLDILLERFFKPWFYPDFLFYLSPTGQKSRRYVRILQNFTNNIIQRRKEEVKKRALFEQFEEDSSMPVEAIFDERNEMAKGSKQRRMDFLDILLAQHLRDPVNFDLVAIREQTDTFMFGGYDTVSTSIYFALFLLGVNADKQAKVHDELDSIFNGKEDFNRPITADDLMRMSYLELCIKESMRIYPPVPFYSRTLVEDLHCNGHLVPKGCTFMVLTSSVHRDPEVYGTKGVEKYIPERFDKTSSSSILTTSGNAFGMISFSAGSRNCIGQRFAKLEMKIVLATLLRKYTIRSLTKQEDITLNFAIVAQSLTPIKMEFTRRVRAAW